MSVRYDRRTRVKMLEAGCWQGHDGRCVGLADMPAGHLVNALLKALAAGEPATITRPLAAEVARRRLQDYALRIAATRGGKRR